MTELLMIAKSFFNFIESIHNKIFIVLLYVIGIIAPISTFYHVMVFFISINLISGIIEDKKRGEKFQYAKFKVFILRLCFYMLSITGVFIFERYIVGMIGVNSRYMTAVVTGMICLYEINSFFINASKITGNDMFLKMKDLVNKIFKKNTDKNENNPA